MTRRVLCLWLPQWPIQRLVVARRDLEGMPLVLYQTQGSRGKRVSACSRQARLAGIRPGVTVAEASALSAAVDGTTQIEEWDPQADQQRLKELAEWSERYTPVVGWKTISELPWSMPDGLFLEVGGTAKVLGGEKALAEQILQEVRQLGYYPRVTVADTPGAALAVARYATTFQEPTRFVEVGEIASRIWERLPIESLRLKPATISLLHRLGVLHWSDLRALPRASLASRLGNQPAVRMAQMTGEIAEQIEPHRPPPEFRECHTLEYPTASRKTLELWTQMLLERLTKRLREEGQGVLRLLCRFNAVRIGLPLIIASGKVTGGKVDDGKVDDGEEEPPSGELSKGDVLEMDVGLFRPTARVGHLWGLIQMQLEQSVIPTAVRQIVLEVLVSSPLRQKQGELFGKNLRRPRELAGLLERLSSRLGRDAVLQTKLRREPLPEDTFAEQPVAGRARQSPSRNAHLNQLRLQDPMERPLFFYQPPKPVCVEVTAGGEPRRLLLPLEGVRSTWCDVGQCWGPERLETSWWRGPSVRRDYFRVETMVGERFWIFRRLADGYWFLHGAF